MDIVSYILSTTFTKKSLEGMGALKGASCTISSIVDNPDGTHDITFSWKDNSDVTHTSVLTVANGETPTITSTEIEGGHTLTFTTTDPSQSVSFNVMDGAEGQRGVSVIRADVDNNNYLKLELSDGNIINAGQIKTVSMVDNTLSLESANPVENRVITSALNDKVNKVSGKQLSTEDFTTAEKNKLANIENGAQVNTLENLIINGEEATIVDKKIALNIITSAVSNLQNYYLKSETYTKTEVEELIGSTVGVTIEIVQQLPTVGQTNVIYFLPTETTNVYSQYIYTANDGWVLIGSTSVDLSNYYTKGQVDTLLNGKQNVLTIDAFPTAMSNNPVASGGVYSAIAQMQPQFQFTNMPVASESNYGFVYQYVGNAGTYEPNMFYRCVYNTYAGEYRWEEVIFHATVVVDSELSSTSINPVQNKVVKAALDTKQDIMQFSTMPSAQDNLGKIVQYTGATTATYQNGCFYKAVYDSEHDTYIWTIVRFSADISVDNVLSDVSENPVQNKVITKKFDEYKTAFTGTKEEWNALTSEQQNVYDIINITNDGDVLNLGIYLEKKTAMPVASEDVVNRIYLYTGTTTQDFKKGVVYQCVSDGQTPATYSWVALIDFGTAALKNSTDRVSPNNTDLVESQSVYSAINTALSSIYSPRGEITCAELTSELLISDNIGNVYETSDSGTTTALFLQGAGHPIAVGSNVGIINAGEGRILFNLMANAFDLTDYQKKELTQAVEGATTVEGALGVLSTNKADKASSATAGDIATLDANGNLVDSGINKNGFVRTGVITTSSGDGYKKVVLSFESYLNGRFYFKDRRGNEYVIMLNSASPTIFYRLAQVGGTREYIVEVRYTRVGTTEFDVFIHSYDFDAIGYTFIGGNNVNIAVSDSDSTEFETGTAITWKKFITDEIVPSDASASNQLVAENNRGIGKFVATDISTAGWYKICEVGTQNQGVELTINLGSTYTYNRSCAHMINFAYGYNSGNMTEIAKDDSQVFDKIRFVYIDNSTRNIVLVHYNVSNKNGCYATINGSYNSNPLNIYNFESVDESEYTNYIEYDLGTDGAYKNGEKLVTESDLNPVAITTPTPVSGVTGGDSLIYGFKSGKMVTIVLNGIIMANNITQNQPIFTNVPTAVGNKNIYFTVLDYESGKSAVMSIIGNALDAAFQSDDKNAVRAGRYWGTVTYMTSD